MGFLRHYERLLSEMEGFPAESADEYAADMQILCDRNFNVACETGIRYPTLPGCASHAEPRRDAHEDFGEICIAGYPMISQVIPCCVWDILIHCHLCRAPIAT